jgi:hypothetical protein
MFSAATTAARGMKEKRGRLGATAKVVSHGIENRARAQQTCLRNALRPH